MKKIYSLSLALAATATLTTGAQTLADAHVIWGNVFTNSNIVGANPTSAGYGLAVARDGGVFTLGNVGSKAASETLYYGDATLGTGSNYGGNSANLNLCIARVDADGALLWSITGTTGEIDNSNGATIVATPDGGAVAYVNLRPTQGYEADQVAIVDAAGTTHTLTQELGSDRHYEPVVMKIDAQGAITWLKQLTVNAVADEATYPAWTQGSRNIGQGIYAYALDVDAAGNIYLGGRMCASVTIDGTTIEPHNVDAWIGDSQKGAGNLYVIKLDADGNYVSHLLSGGAATSENLRALRVVGNRLYAFGLAEGIAGTELTLGEHSVTPANAYPSLFAAALTLDLDVDWLAYYQSTMSGSTMQMPTMTVTGDRLYLMGTAKMGMTLGETAYATVNARDPWMLQVDATTGQALACLTYKDFQHGFFGAYEGVDGNLYAIERGLGSMNAMANLGNVHMGTAIHCIDPAEFTTTPADGTVLVDRTADGYGALTDGTTLYVYDRLPNGNKTATYTGSDLAFTSSAFLARLSAYELPATAGAVQDITIEGASSLMLSPGESVGVTATVLPEDAANSAIIWSSTDESIVTVDEDGMVTAVEADDTPAGLRRAQGEAATAIVTATSSSNPAVKRHIAVTVQAGDITAVADLNAGTDRTADIYTADGRLVRRGTTDCNGLPAGIYIAGGKKIVVK